VGLNTAPELASHALPYGRGSGAASDWRTASCLARCVGLAVLLASGWAQDAGERVHDVNPDDARMLGVAALGQMYAARTAGRATEETEKLFLATVAEYGKEDWNRAYRQAARLLLRLHGVEISEATEVATALDFQLERKLVTPGERLGVRVQPLYALGRPLTGKYAARISVRSEAGQAIETLGPIEIAQLKDEFASVATSNLKPGRYVVVYELLAGGDKPVVSVTRDFQVDPDVKRRVTALRQKVDRLKQARVATRGATFAAALETIEYIAGILDRALNSYVSQSASAATPMATMLVGPNLSLYSTEPFHVERDLALGDELAMALLAKKDPLPTRTGDLRLAYRSGVDGSLQPFRVYVPEGFDPSRKYPLIVALHGATGDENTYMDRYLEAETGENLFKKLGQERGYILASPNGRGPWDGYQGNSEQDVLDVIDRVVQLYPISPDRVFLTGHSMGGSGTWMIGFKHPQRFAALAPVASNFGGRMSLTPVSPLKNAPEMAVLFSAGLKDTLAPPENCRKMAALAKQELKRFRYVEYPDDHFLVGVSSMKAIFDFFDEVRR
jgi:poly(3-hydroxybutyrate) depolymerase